MATVSAKKREFVQRNTSQIETAELTRVLVCVCVEREGGWNAVETAMPVKASCSINSTTILQVNVWLAFCCLPKSPLLGKGSNNFL